MLKKHLNMKIFLCQNIHDVIKNMIDKSLFCYVNLLFIVPIFFQTFGENFELIMSISVKINNQNEFSTYFCKSSNVDPLECLAKVDEFFKIKLPCKKLYLLDQRKFNKDRKKAILYAYYYSALRHFNLFKLIFMLLFFIRFQFN